MRAFTRKPKTTQQTTPAKSKKLGPARFGRDPGANLSLDLHRAIGSPAAHASLTNQIQPKMEVNAPGDIYEQQADDIADAVMQIPDHATPRVARSESHPRPLPSSFGGQRKDVGRKAIEDEDDVIIEKHAVAEKCACEEDNKRLAQKAEVPRVESSGVEAPPLEPHIEAGIRALRGGGQPLPLSERGFMQTRFDADFSGIRIHTNQDADSYSRAIHARAFTWGSDIFFRAGEYRPGSSEGRRLLAHELTHAIQQGAAQPRPLNDLRISACTIAHPTLQRQPPPTPSPAPVVAPAGRATLNFLPILTDRVPAGWGVTAPDRAVLDITAYASGGDWKCVVTTADQQTHQGTRLLAGVVEVTPALVAAEASCAVLQTMITSLNSVANQGSHSGYYMLAAVQAHEDVHVTQWQTGIAPHYTTLKTAVEALTVPLASHGTAAAAKAAIKALPAFTAAMATFRAAESTVASATASHSPIAPFNTAEHGVVDPTIATIRARRTTLKCPP
jgi:hypothetical protein